MSFNWIFYRIDNISLGGKMDYSALAPAKQTYDPQLLAGIFANRQLPQGTVPFAPFQAGKAVR